MVEIRECLPDNAGLRKRRMKDRQRQVVNFHPLVFTEMSRLGAGGAAVGIVVPAASAGGGILMAGAGKEENLLMAGAYGNHARSAYDDQQKGEQHDAVAQCSNHGMPRILERSRGRVKTKVTDAGNGDEGKKAGTFSSCHDGNMIAL